MTRPAVASLATRDWELWCVTAAAAATPAAARATANAATRTVFFKILSSYWVRRFLRAPAGRGLRPLLGRDLADDLTGRDRLSRLDGEVPDRAGAVRVHLVLHLHRLDDADHLTRSDFVSFGHRHGEDRP